MCVDVRFRSPTTRATSNQRTNDQARELTTHRAGESASELGEGGLSHDWVPPLSALELQSSSYWKQAPSERRTFRSGATGVWKLFYVAVFSLYVVEERGVLEMSFLQLGEKKGENISEQQTYIEYELGCRKIIKG